MLLFATLLTLAPLQMERAFSGQYLYETKEGVYVCAGCQTELFDSKDKYDSGAGWPCFSNAKNIYYLPDPSPFNRYEVRCKGCEKGLGHVFKDGPPPKGLRYCIHSLHLILLPR